MSAEKLDTEVRREQIAQTALSVIAELGMRGLKVSELAGRIGLVPSAIYRHFKGKGEVLDAVLDLIRDRLLDNVRAARLEAQRPLPRLKSLLLRHVKLVLEYQALPRIIFSEEVYSDDPGRKTKLRGIIQMYLEEVAAIVRQGQGEGVIRADLSPDAVAVMFLGLFQPAIFLSHLTGGEFDVAGQVEKAWQIFCDGLST